MVFSYFIDIDGVVHTNYGTHTTAGYKTKINGATVYHLDDEGFILEEYTLYNSLHSLADSLEPDYTKEV